MARLEPLPERQVLAQIKARTGIAVAILERQLAELRRRLNASGDPTASRHPPDMVARCGSTSPACPSATRPT